MDPDNLSAFVFGYTGGAGRAIVNALAVEPRFKRVVLFGRRIVDLDKEKESSSQKIPGDFTKFRQDVVDFDKLSENSEYFAEKLKDFDVGIYTLGVNPFNSDEQTFNRITKDWLLAVGKLAKDGGCKHFHKMSGMLVKQNSWLKMARFTAEVEDQLCKLNFQRVSIYKPATILTPFNGGGMTGPTMVSITRFLDRCHWISIEADIMGKFLVENCFTKNESNPIQVFSNAEMNRWWKQLNKK